MPVTDGAPARRGRAMTARPANLWNQREIRWPAMSHIPIAVSATVVAPKLPGGEVGLDDARRPGRESEGRSGVQAEETGQTPEQAAAQPLHSVDGHRPSAGGQIPRTQALVEFAFDIFSDQ